MSTIKAGEKNSIILDEGNILNVTAGSNSSGIIYKCVDSSGTNSSQSWSVDANSSQVIGPFIGVWMIRFDCSAGSFNFTEISAASQAAQGSSVVLISAISALSNWFRGDISGKKMVWVGDSTTFQIEQSYIPYLVNTYQSPGGPLAGVTVNWFGANGNTLSNFVSNLPAGKGINDVIAAAPDLIVLSYGINDVRLGTTSQTQLIALLKSAVNTLRAALPNCDIILRMPNSFLTTDVGAAGYIVPNSSAQAYTDINRNSYRSLRNYWPNVVVYDSQDSTFSPVCPTLSLYMTDQLHPTAAGYSAIMDAVAVMAGRSSTYNKELAADAVNTSYANAHLTYPRVVENGDYQLITQGPWSTQGDGFIRFDGDQGQITSIAGGDIVVQDGVAAFTLPNFPAVTITASRVQINSLGSGIPTYAQTNGLVQVWRHKYIKNLACKAYINDAAFPFQERFIINSGGTNFIRLQTRKNAPDISLFNVTTADYLLHPDLGPLSLASATFAYQAAGVLQINMTGAFASVSGHYQCYLVSAGAMRRTKSNAAPIRYDRQSVIAATADGFFVMARGGYYASAYGKLSAALSTTSTVVVVKNNGTAVATLTFTAGSTTATVAWASGTGFTAFVGDVITYDVTVGVGTANMSIVLDA